MDSKNVIAAIALSSAVIVLYSLFFAPEQSATKQNLDKKKIEQNTDTPSLEQTETLIKLSREDALNESKRVKFENESIIGSISLKGASIDDLTFKNYNTKLESDEKIILLAPRNIEEGYLIESGFVTSDKNIDIPDAETIWSLDGNNKLTNQSPIKLSWTNKQGITFEKEISLDNNFLFPFIDQIVSDVGISIFLSDVTKPLSIK